jgi:hypothetical protein
MQCAGPELLCRTARGAVQQRCFNYVYRMTAYDHGARLKALQRAEQSLPCAFTLLDMRRDGKARSRRVCGVWRDGCGGWGAEVTVNIPTWLQNSVPEKRSACLDIPCRPLTRTPEPQGHDPEPPHP